MVPSFGGGDDGLGVGLPDERLGLTVVRRDEAVDGLLQGDHRGEHAAFELALGELGEQGLDRVQPGARGGGEVEDPARVPGQPAPHFGVLVGAVVVEDDVDHLARRHGALDGVEEAEELLVPVALHALADDRAVEDIEGREQRGRAVPLVIMGHGLGAALLQRQARLGAVERLDLALFVDRQHHGVRRRIDVQPDDVLDLGGEVGIGRELEAAHLMGAQTVRPPDPLHRADAEPAGRGQRRRRPVGHAVRRRLCQRARHDPLDDGLGQRRDACRPRLVAQQAVHAVGHEPLLPAPHGRFRHAGPAHHLRSAAALRARQNDPGPHTCLCGLLRSATIAASRARSAAVTSISIPLRMTPAYHRPCAKGIFR